MWKDPYEFHPKDKQKCRVIGYDNKTMKLNFYYAQYTPGYMSVRTCDEFTFWDLERDCDITVLVWREVESNGHIS